MARLRGRRQLRWWVATAWSLPLACGRCLRTNSSLLGRLPILKRPGQDPAWDAYLTGVYGDRVPEGSYPVDLSEFTWFYYKRLPLRIEPALLDPHCQPRRYEAWVGEGPPNRVLPESMVSSVGFFVQQYDATPRAPTYPYRLGFRNHSWVEVMRAAMLHRDETFATFFWFARGSGIWLNLGETHVVESRMAATTVVARFEFERALLRDPEQIERYTWDTKGCSASQKAHLDAWQEHVRTSFVRPRALHTLQLPVSVHFPFYPMKNNRFEVLRLVPGTHNLEQIRRRHSQRQEMHYSDCHMCHLPYRTGWVHDQACDCDPQSVVLTCGQLFSEWRVMQPSAAASQLQSVSATGVVSEELANRRPMRLEWNGCQPPCRSDSQDGHCRRARVTTNRTAANG